MIKSVYVKGILVVILATSFSGCATVFLGKSKGVYITSNVEDSKVYDGHNKQIGTTPFIFNPTKKRMGYQLSVEKEGYAPVPVIINFQENRDLAALDAMLFCIPCIVDYPTGNIFRPDKDSVRVVLKKVLDKAAEKVNLYYEPIEWGIKDGLQIGEEYKEPLYFKKSFLESYLYKDAVIKASNGSLYSILNVGNEENFRYVKKPSLVHIQPLITDLKSSLIKRKGVSVRRCEVTIKWTFSQNDGKKILKEVSETNVKEIPYEETKQVLASLMEASAVNVFNQSDVYDILLRVSNLQVENEGSPSVDALILPRYFVPAFSKSKDLIRHLMKSVLTIEHNEGHGSGFLISEDGYLITNYHVIKNKKVVNVRLNESIVLSADVIRGDDLYDVALLKITGKGFSPLQVMPSDSVEAGDDVFAIGTPEDIALGQSVTKGIVSGKRKLHDRVYIQTDVAINSGNSGGPLLSDDGRVIGMVTSKLVGEGIEGIGFCVPSNTIFEILNIKYR